MTYTTTGYFGYAGGGKNGAVVDAWLASRFGAAPAENAAPPSGVADAGPVTTSTTFGGPGAYTLTLPSVNDYYVRVQYGGNSYWSALSSGSIVGGGGGGGGGVSTVFGRSGAVVATSGDYTAAQVTGALVASNNLSDVGSAVTALGNLGVTTVYMPPPSGDTSGAADAANLATAQARLTFGMGSIVWGNASQNNPYYLPANSGNIPSFQHWYGQGMGATIIRLANSQNGNLIITNGFNTYNHTDTLITCSPTSGITGCVLSGNQVTNTPGSFSSVNVGDQITGTGIQQGSIVTAVASAALTISPPVNFSGSGITILTSSTPLGFGLHDLTLDGNWYNNGTNLLAQPSGVSASATTGSGAVPWYYRVTALNSIGETQGSAEVTCNNAGTLSAGVNENTVSWSAVSGATSYNLYRSSYSSNTEVLYAVLGNVTSYVDKSAGTSTGWQAKNCPCVNTSGGRVLGTYGYNWVMENVEIKDGGSAGWDAQAPQAGQSFNFDVQWCAYVNGLEVHGNRGGGIELRGPSDAQWVNVTSSDSGTDFSHTGGTNTAQIDINTSGLSLTNFHTKGGIADYGIRVSGTLNQLSDGQIEGEATACLAVHGDRNTVSNAEIYASTAWSSITVIDGGLFNTFRCTTRDGKTAALKRLNGAQGSTYDIKAIFSSTTPNPAVIGQAMDGGTTCRIPVFTEPTFNALAQNYATGPSVVIATTTHATKLDEVTLASTGSWTDTLPTPFPNGRCWVTNSGAGTITMATPSGNIYNITGGTGVSVLTHTSASFVSDGTHWYQAS